MEFNDDELFTEDELLEIFGIEKGKHYIDVELLKYLLLENFYYLGDTVAAMIKDKNLSIDEINQNVANLLIDVSISNKDNSARSSGSLQNNYDRLNSREKELILRYPGYAVYYYSVSKKAENDAIWYYSPNVLTSDNGDAFRHAYWNALMTERFAWDSRSEYYDVTFGQSLAKLFADAREYGLNNIDSDMNFYNNSVGRNIFRELFNSISWFENYVSDSKIRDKVLSDVSNGRMRIIVNNRLAWSDSYGRIR